MVRRTVAMDCGNGLWQKTAATKKERTNMATKTKSAKSRIRWTAQESDIVIRAAQEMQAKGIKLTSERRLARAQAALPKDRRRPYSANLGSWLSKAMRGEAPGPASARAAGPAQAGQGARPLPADPATAALTQALIASGAAILRGILLDPGVQKALRQALR